VLKLKTHGKKKHCSHEVHSVAEQMPIVNFVLAGSLQVRCKDMPAGQIGIGQTIIFVPCGFFFLLSSSFFPRLISTVGDWILPYMVWPWCKFRMQV